jgi:DNA polymerase I-like protein with 3'-5' exonuclease and polymerase domains
MNLFGVLREDRKKAVWLASQEEWFPHDVEYILQPSIEQAKEFLAKAEWHERNDPLPLTVDLENPEIENEEEHEQLGEPPILQVQFSLQSHTGIVFPWIAEYKEITRRLLSTSLPKWGHNTRKYDFPLFERSGFRIHGEWHDTMDLFRMVQSDLNGCYHLQGVGSFFGCDQIWKHKIGESLEFYGAMDVDAPQRIISQLVPAAKRLGVWDTYMRHVVEMEPILVKMCERGLARDEEGVAQLQKEIKEHLSNLRGKINQLIPRELLKCRDYKREPKEIKETKMSLGMDYSQETLESKALTLGYERNNGVWTKWEIFNPGSPKQLQDYSTYKGYKIPKHPKEDRPTMNEWALRGLLREARKKKDKEFIEFLELVLQYSESSTILDNFLGGKWSPQQDGKTHSTFFSARTASGQFASRNPNIQNIPR